MCCQGAAAAAWWMTQTMAWLALWPVRRRRRGRSEGLPQVPVDTAQLRVTWWAGVCLATQHHAAAALQRHASADLPRRRSQRLHLEQQHTRMHALLCVCDQTATCAPRACCRLLACDAAPWARQTPAPTHAACMPSETDAGQMPADGSDMQRMRWWLSSSPPDQPAQPGMHA